MAKQGFTLNKAAVAHILKTVDGGKREAAQRVLEHIDDPEAFIEVYQTDREVVGVVVPADKQAKNGVATRAASAAGLSQGRPG